jgi:hypothetical protein
MKKILLSILVLLAISVVAYMMYDNYKKQQIVKAINSFEMCAEMFPVMESYPARCVTSDGRSFTQDIGNELEYQNDILLDHPRPNQVVETPLIIKGKARGYWFFEANFSAELFDANNKSLGVAVVSSEGEWMTENFVPFQGELSFGTPQSETGTLRINNANPSGLPENDKQIVMPVRFR